MGRLPPIGAIVATVLFSSTVAYGDAPTRGEYIRAADRLCAKAIKPTRDAWRGFDRNVDNGDYQAAAKQVARARTILANSVRAVAALARPEGDGPLLARLFASKRKEVRIYRRSERAFRHEKPKAGLRWIKVRLRQRSHSRRIVAGYGFNQCGGGSARP